MPTIKAADKIPATFKRASRNGTRTIQARERYGQKSDSSLQMVQNSYMLHIVTCIIAAVFALEQCSVQNQIK